MATEFIREKINSLRQLILQEEVQKLQHELLVQAAAQSTGDAQVDQNMRAQANNSQAQIMGTEARVAVYRQKLAELEQELSA